VARIRRAASALAARRMATKPSVVIFPLSLSVRRARTPSAAADQAHPTPVRGCANGMNARALSNGHREIEVGRSGFWRPDNNVILARRLARIL